MKKTYANLTDKIIKAEDGSYLIPLASVKASSQLEFNETFEEMMKDDPYLLEVEKRVNRQELSLEESAELIIAYGRNKYGNGKGSLG